ncbi:TonB-dependent receptor [Leptospira idonii]|uniref:TonB-dependent receptor n=1 Tax=Leptospira idonii TaxID=1193500 RepID=A0A4R9LVK0_9LEPT|nr:TonB-dependent receptor [Leptospira idonii]TGN16933.1 TonB-dependent receptor [Leptospira idonii]
MNFSKFFLSNEIVLKKLKLHSLRKIIPVVLFLFGTSIYALDFNIKGDVLSANGKPIENAKLFLQETKQTSSVDKQGSFEYQHLPPGTYTLFVSAGGFQPETTTIDLKDKDEKITIILLPSNLEFQSINVTAKSNLADFLNSPQSTTVVKGRQLQRQRGENIATTLQNTPGVSALTTGAGSAKPVIRGLSGQRVLVMSDGVRQEDQQFGDDHTVDLDAFGISQVEVVKGPGSVLYGSDALGGVVNVIRNKAPTKKDGAPTLAGTMSYNGFSNNKQDAGDLSLYGYNHNSNIGYRVQANDRKAGRISTPNGIIPNTGFTESNKSVSVGTDGAWGNIYLDSFRREFKQDLYDNPNENPGAQVSQSVIHDKNHLHSFFIFALGNLEVDAGYQRNNRREIPDKNIYVPIQKTLLDSTISDFTKAYNIYQVNQFRTEQGLNLSLDTGTLDVKFHHKPILGWKGTIGVSGMNQKNATRGTEPLIPGYLLINLAGFLLEEYKLGDFTFSGGLRADKRSVDIKANTDLGVSEETKNFSATTGTLGSVWRFSKPLSLILNVGKGFRSPTPFELYSNGVHEGTGRFETGKNQLKPETSVNYDTALRYASSKIQAEVTFFQNTIQDYIYSVSQGKYDEESRLPVYQYRQDRAVLTGGEFFIQAELTKNISMNGGIDLLKGSVYKKVDPSTFLTIEDTDLSLIYNDLQTKALPRMAPNRSRLGFRFSKEELFSLQKPYLSVSGRFISSQYRVDKLETTTAGYNLYDIGFGFEIPSLNNEAEPATFDFAVMNVFNKAYVDHMSRYKDYALNPGINATFKLTIPLTIIN